MKLYLVKMEVIAKDITSASKSVKGGKIYAIELAEDKYQPVIGLSNHKKK